MHGALILGDGTVMEGSGFGRPAETYGELVFNTGMVGYTETLTDPSYGGQILTLTYPLVGNYGVPDPSERDSDGIPSHFESDRIHARGLVVHELSSTASHWNLSMTLDEWMYNEGIPGISGIDTRALTRRLRDGGVMMAALAVSKDPIDVPGVSESLACAKTYGTEQLAGAASAGTGSFGSGPKCIVVIDAGAKNAILRNIVSMGYKAVRVPWNASIQEVLSHDPKGVIISNGPGDPQMCPETIQTARALIERNIPTLGICLGAQIMGLAGGASTYKLKYGHRGQNKPCLDVSEGRVYVTSQNHGYCIDPDSLDGSAFEPWFTNTDDHTIEGIKHRNGRSMAVQFHPEASPGPYDCRFIFRRLRSLMEEGSTAKK
ncbi:carbamoylphosphate synthase small subunit [Cenarchaeum symbiosum A]|uniref:Carbamoyl phosphate synthase small chain n=1 Tax=Cenarchaeum symbiosum (strain A) TaxID=414004 RepID=A0RVN7_CENSY|nr:carbamoylphosphate synthase small subunit [Cenarchaeum symbiosum A]